MAGKQPVARFPLTAAEKDRLADRIAEEAHALADQLLEHFGDGEMDLVLGILGATADGLIDRLPSPQREEMLEDFVHCFTTEDDPE